MCESYLEDSIELDGSIGTCGKDGQSVPVGMLTIKLDRMTVGGTERATARMIQVEVRKWSGTGVDRSFGWQPVSVNDGLRLRDETFRCPECFGKVRLMSASVDPPMAAHGEHFRRNKGCSFGDCFDGAKRIHPSALK
jgi:hypothetical protein